MIGADQCYACRGEAQLLLPSLNSALEAARPYRLGQTVAHQVTKRLGDRRNNGFSYAAVGIPGPASPAWSRVPPRVGESIRRDSLAVA
jgi:hypothetical protein